MNKKLLMVSFVVIMLILPLTTVAGFRQQAQDTTQITIGESDNDDKVGVFPAFVFVTCNWKKTGVRTGERTLHFWVIGFGYHTLEWDTWDDINGDGEYYYTFGTIEPKEFNLFLIRHFEDGINWKHSKTDPIGPPSVKVVYWLDGKQCDSEIIFNPIVW